MHRIAIPELGTLTQPTEPTQPTELTELPELTLSGATVRHLRVLRLNIGETVQVFDGQGLQAQAVLSLLDEHQAVLRLLEPPAPDHSREYMQTVTLGVALLKGDKLADVVRATTELGVHAVQLLLTEHADVRDIGQQKLKRLRRIASEAARQCGRSHTPKVHEPIALKTWFSEHKQLEQAEQTEQLILLAHPGSSTKLVDVVHWNKSLIVITGPEGGFSEAEVLQLRNLGAQCLSLGPRILRAETAPVALLGALSAL